jgi:hypothetical protein
MRRPEMSRAQMMKYLQSLLLAALLPPFSEIIRPYLNLFPSFKETLSQYYSNCEEKYSVAIKCEYCCDQM